MGVEVSGLEMVISHLLIDDTLQKRTFLPLSLFKFGFEIQLDKSSFFYSYATKDEKETFLKVCLWKHLICKNDFLPTSQ